MSDGSNDQVSPITVAGPLNDGEESRMTINTKTVAPASTVPVIVGTVLVGDGILSMVTDGSDESSVNVLKSSPCLPNVSVTSAITS